MTKSLRLTYYTEEKKSVIKILAEGKHQPNNNNKNVV